MLVRRFEAVLAGVVWRTSRKLAGSKLYEILNLDWHRKAVGGVSLWDEIGRLELDFLIEQGLRPKHNFLDVGCGSLRGGVHFIRYLDPGHYFGIDKSRELLDAGRKIELKRNNLTDKNHTLVQMDNFDFLSLSKDFDYALAASVFTHLPLNSIIRCIMNIEKVLVQGGRFYATFFENPHGKMNLEPVTRPRADGGVVTTYFDKDPYHYDFQTFEQICEGTSLDVEYIGEWSLGDQKMMVFLRT